jgi:hypothetical protein
MLKPCLLVATLGLTVLATGCGPEEVVTTGTSTTPPCGGTPEACAELEKARQLVISTTPPGTPTEPCAGTPEACAELEKARQLVITTTTPGPTTPPCAGTPEACGVLTANQ